MIGPPDNYYRYLVLISKKYILIRLHIFLQSRSLSYLIFPEINFYDSENAPERYFKMRFKNKNKED